jgi:hypothetical protein
MTPMPVVTDRIRERLVEDYRASAPRVLSRLESLTVHPSVDPERIHAAVLIAARGNLSLFDDALEHARDDWRDLLDRAGLADADWPGRLDATFGTA